MRMLEVQLVAWTDGQRNEKGQPVEQCRLLCNGKQTIMADTVSRQTYRQPWEGEGGDHAQ